MIKFVATARGRIAKLVADAGVPYSAVRRLLRKKDVKLNGKRVKDDLMCEIGDLIEVYYVDSIPLNIVYADENVVALNKPAGITSEDFYEKIKAAYPSALAVHRLDRNTRGIMIYALNKSAEAELINGFKERTFKKLYVAEVKGVPSVSSALLTAYLEKDESSGGVYIHNSKQSGDVEIKTAYRVLKSSGGTAVLEVELITGKMHQIRAHLSHIGHPIIGDGRYGDVAFNKKMGCSTQRLQAFSLTLFFSEGDKLFYLNGRELSVSREF